MEHNVCLSPEPGKLHGFVASPGNFIYTHARAPILSYARMAPFHDILVPCPFYVNNPVAQDEKKTETEDSIPFHDKLKVVYWRGRSTGGHALRTTWRYGHRQRFVGFVHALQRAAEVFDVSRFFFGPSIRGWGERTTTTTTTTRGALRIAFDVQMGGFIQCDEEVCDEMERVLGHAHFEGQDAERQFRYLYDLDGNGMSGRFYHLLSQRAVVLKQTWFQEWHDERLLPWAHYIPVTMGMEELPSVVDFLINDPDGERISAEIAEAGSAWSRRVLRDIDMSVYVYRLLLEMAAIFKPLDPDEKVWETVTEQLL
ncbi:glycosyltransferase family 90 protein [Aspergillus aculeatus ATCC 16872]|uniref:Glycosyltransferase family 90 protein n=1 Tax=Aspergillus aculeatus (strain ATCC 16872 / CBS 172.66 / WB 5094) TaxID=690307 RepID=A0A1L9WQ42_ASPA1|nr:glycosyltransferase family 90 protein [Aspergillus aculeatus ATCC 16872]OJJ98296.1 glycosyltransferase family 90 protein [Aspergillus aculeatus ATCC 16872]